MDSGNRTRLRELQAAINASIDQYVETPAEDPKNKGKLAELQATIIDQTMRIHAEVASPVSRVLHLSWSPAINLAARTAIDLNLYNLIPESGIGLDELVEKTGANKNIILRVLRMLAASHIITETSQNTFAATPTSKALTIKEMRDCFKMSHDNMHPIMLAIPSYLKKTHYADMTSTSNAAYDLHGRSLWEWLARDPEEMATFQSAMKIQDSLPPETVPEYPFSEAFESIGAGEVGIVDVGGGRGFALRDLFEKYPDFPGRLILEDYPSVIEDAKTADLPGRIEMIPHDATDTQPVQGAKFYYFRRVFHTWPDPTAIQALKALHMAFKKGYSKLLIQDEVMKDFGCDAQKATQDISMMVAGAMERSEGQWRDLLGEGGFRVVRIVRAEVGCLGVIEAEMV